MNKGFKNNTKIITQKVANVAEIGVNINKEDSNLHITMPLLSTVGKCPISTSLIFDYQSKESSFGFGRGTRLNFYSRVEEVANSLRVINNDGSTDVYLADNEYFNVQTGITFEKKDSGEYDFAYIYNAKDKQNNSMEFIPGKNYPKIITKANGDKIIFDFISQNTISNEYGDVIRFVGEGKFNRVEYYHNDELLAKAEIFYDSNDYLDEIIYYNNKGKQVKRLSIITDDDEIIVRDMVSNYRIRYEIENGAVTSIRDGYDDNFAGGETISINAVDGKTTVTSSEGQTSYVIYDNGEYPLYEVDNNGSVVEYVFNKSTNQMIFCSNPMHTRDVNENLANGVIPVLQGVTETEVDVADELGVKLVGTKAKKYVGNGTIVYNIDESGIETDSITAMVFGRYVDGTYNNVDAEVKLECLSAGSSNHQSSNSYISSVRSGDFDAAVVGLCANSCYSGIRITVTVPEGAAMEIGGIKLIKQECGAFYNYDNKGNIIETIVGHKSKNTAYTEAGKADETIAVNSDLVHYEYNDINQLICSKHAHGTIVDYKYDETHKDNVLRTTVKNDNEGIKFETSRNYTEDGRFVASETDVNGMVTTYEYEDAYGNIRQIRDAMSVATNYTYFNDGLIEEIELTDGVGSSKASYTYDNKDRIETITLSNGSVYTFEYDSFGNISVIKLGGVVAFRYEYDEKNRLIRQHYGSTGDFYEFTYTQTNNIDEIYYVNNGISILKYTYTYDIINRVSEVRDSEHNLLYSYEYDANGRVVKVVNAESIVEVGYDNLGNVNIKKTTVNGKTVTQSFDSVNRSKGSQPEAIQQLGIAESADVFFGLFNHNDLSLYNCKNNFIPVISHFIKLSTTSDDFIPCSRIDSSRLMSYQFAIEDRNDKCGFVSFCFKPDNLASQCIFSVKDPNGKGSITVYMNQSGTVNATVTDMSGNKYEIITCRNKVVAGKWNYFAMSFMNVYDDFTGGRTEFAINLNGHIDNYNRDTMIWFDLSTMPLYNIGHEFEDELLKSYLSGYVTCVTISPVTYVSPTYLAEHYASIKEHRINSILVDDEHDVATVDFSDVNLYTDNSDVTSRFEIYPLHNSLQSLDGKLPTKFRHRRIGKADKDRSFRFNHDTKRYAFVADGLDLEYNFGAGDSGTVMMRAFVDSYEDKQYFFDMKDASGHTLGLFRDSVRTVCVDFNGATISTGIVFPDNTWKTIALSFTRDVESESLDGIMKFVLRVFVDGQVYQFRKETDYTFGELSLAVGITYTPDFKGSHLMPLSNYLPLLGQIEMLATSGAFCEEATLLTAAEELKTYTKLCEFNTVGMLRKTELHLAGTPILSDIITYKKNGDKDTVCVAGETFSHGNSTRVREYETDLYGRVTAISDSVLGNHTYEYDYRGFLVREDNKEFTYDGNGNITSCGDTVFTYDSVIKDRLMSVGGKAVTYSESNPLNPASYDGKTFSFEGRRLVGVSAENMSAAYKYDSFGHRVEKTLTENGITKTIRFFYDGDKLISECCGTERVDYLYDENGMLYGFFYNGAKYFYIRDTMQNILGIIDASGACVVQYNYSAYGECISVTGDMAGTVGEVNSFRYKGYYFDRETGFFYCKSRYYLPEWKRWLNSDDPSFLDFSNIHRMNIFNYCSNNPIMCLDNGGNVPIWVIVESVVVTVVAVAAIVTIAAIAINHAVNGIMSLVANSQIKDKYTEEEAKEEIEKITGKETVDIKDSYVKILNSVNIKSRFQRIKISKIIKNTVNEEGNKLTKRTTYGLASEWLGHNLFNRIYDNDSTRDVNLDYEFKENAWYTKVGTIALMIFGCL